MLFSVFWKKYVDIGAMVSLESTPGLTGQDARHFSSMSSNKLKWGAISSWLIIAELALFYQPPWGLGKKRVLLEQQKYAGRCLDEHRQTHTKQGQRSVNKKGRTDRRQPEVVVCWFNMGQCPLKHKSFLCSHCCQSCSSLLTAGQQWPQSKMLLHIELVDWCSPVDTDYVFCFVIFLKHQPIIDPFLWSFVIIGAEWFRIVFFPHFFKTFSYFFLISTFCPPFTPLPFFIFCGPEVFRVGRLFSVRTQQSKAEWELLGLCQSQGSDWRYKSGWKDWGSWILSVWPQFNTRSPIKRDTPDQSIKPRLPPDSPLLLTRSVNPSLNVRRCNVYGLNWQCWCAHLGVSNGKRFH